jgi:hypothetical protein
MTENERCIMKFEDEEVKDELSLDINEQLIQATFQCNELQKKQKLVAIHSEIEILKVVETTKKSRLFTIQDFTVNLNDLHFVAFIVLMRMR